MVGRNASEEHDADDRSDRPCRAHRTRATRRLPVRARRKSSVRHPAAESDRLTDTIDYGVVASTVVGIVEGEAVDLIETLAQRIADACLADPRVDKVQVTVHKPDAPITVPFDDVAVTIERSRA
jgi:dihydroneopterin aldolase